MLSSFVSTLCMSTGAFIAFLLSRYVFRPWFTQFMNRKYPSFHLYDQVIEKEGGKIVFLMQFSLIPYSILCYMLGLSKVRLHTFVFGTLGMFFPNLFWSYCGSFLHSLTDFRGSSKDYYQIIFMCCGFLFAMFGLFKISKNAKESIKL